MRWKDVAYWGALVGVWVVLGLAAGAFFLGPYLLLAWRVFFPG